jgi:hypothetical protein
MNALLKGAALAAFAFAAHANETKQRSAPDVPPLNVSEYACHEGNSSLAGILAGARGEESRAGN